MKIGTLEINNKWIVVAAIVVLIVAGWRVVAGDLGRRPILMLVPTAAAPPIVLQPGQIPAETAELLRRQALRSDVILWGD